MIRCPQSDTRHCRITVPFDYPVLFSDGVFEPDNPALANVGEEGSSRSPAPCIVAVDSGVAEAQPDLLKRIAGYAELHADALSLQCAPLILPGGEEAKNSFAAVMTLIRAARRHRLCRHSYIVAVGGGALLDAAGFAASLIHRGVRLIRIPTTVLAQNDSGIGVKNGINFEGVKNFLGTFAPPVAVINDARFLTTLSDRDWIAGIAEAYKVAIIKDADFLCRLESAQSALVKRDLTAMTTLIRRCAELHLQHVTSSGDPFEFGSARPLDFGHWAAHKLESMTSHTLRHGEAVAIGMALDLLYAARLGFIEPDAARNVIGAMAQTGLPVWDDALHARDAAGRPLLLDGIEDFREHLGGQLHVTLPRPLGRCVDVTTLDTHLICQCIGELSTLHAALQAM